MGCSEGRYLYLLRKKNRIESKIKKLDKLLGNTCTVVANNANVTPIWTEKEILAKYLLFSPSYWQWEHKSERTYTKEAHQKTIIFWRVGPLWYKLPLLGEYSRNPSVSVYQLALSWEATSGFSEFLLKILSTCLAISWWMIYEHTCLHCAECSTVSDQKQHDLHTPPSLFTQSCPKWPFFLVSLYEKKSSKGNVLVI